MFIAQLTDTHITMPGHLVYDRFDSAVALADAVARLNALAPRPDLVIVTGDLVHHGLPEEYEHFQRIMQGLEVPWCAVPGNHDTRTGFGRISATAEIENPLPGFVQFAVQAGQMQLLALDTLHDGHHDGAFCDERFAWLTDALAQAGDMPVVVAMHHPPFATGVRWMDLLNVEWAVRLEQLVARHINVQVVLCGHIHRRIVSQWGGATCVVSPSTTYQVAADLDRLQAHLVQEPPAITLCQWLDGRMVVHHLPVHEDPAPQPLMAPEMLAELARYAADHAGRVPKAVNNRVRKLDR